MGERATGARQHRLRLLGAAAQPLLALLLVALIAVVDLLLETFHFATSRQALLDETGHLATAGLILLVVRRRLPGPAVPAALAASVLIDVDHVPLVFLRSDALTDGTGRPYSHSLLTVVVLALLAGLSRGVWRALALGLALGVLMHFVRDLATGPGIAAFWPLSTTMVEVPYAIYAATLAALVCTIAVRVWRRRAVGLTA